MDTVLLRHVGRFSLVSLAITALACGNEPPKEPAPTSSPAAGAPTAAPASGTPSADGAPVVTKFGVPECDEYVEKYLSCIEGKVTEAEKEKLMSGFDANRTKWRAMSTMKESAVALGIACRAARQKSKEELSVEYGCEF